MWKRGRVVRGLEPPFFGRLINLNGAYSWNVSLFILDWDNPPFFKMAGSASGWFVYWVLYCYCIATFFNELNVSCGNLQVPGFKYYETHWCMAFRLFSALWSGCFPFDTFPIYILNFIWWKDGIFDAFERK